MQPESCRAVLTMAFAAGTRLGVYEITGLIGVGGMGEVYRATDTKLGRKVAIKTLPSELANDPDRLARFEREAKLLATLNHAHIAAIYGLHEHEGTQFLAMELVEGETLERMLSAGGMPVADALRLALQIAEALEAAHEKGVVHRDLKPANVMVTNDGSVKVLDFGLAKAFSGNPGEASPAHSPALSLAMTQRGLILGTAGYMSPEQASGQATDQRADIWAFGVVLFEMLSGAPLFSGESVSHILAEVLKAEPDWSRLPKKLHPRVRALLERCLTKKPRNRLHSIADGRVEIEALLGDPEGSVALGAEERTAHAPAWPWLAVSALIAAAVSGLAVWQLRPATEPRHVNRFAYEMADFFSSRADFTRLIDVSPDGRQFAYRTEQGLMLREMGSLEPRLIAGTDGLGTGPFFSPDGQWVGYSRQEGRLFRIPVSGGAPIPIAEFQSSSWGGASWGSDGAITFAVTDGIYRVPANGGEPKQLIPRENGTLWGPTVLPDGDHVLFTVMPSAEWDTGQIVVQSLATGERTLLVDGGFDARYLATGHIVFAVGEALFAIAFDAERLTTRGSRVALVEDVIRSSQTPSVQYAVAADGTLVYVAGESQGRRRTLVWVYRDGGREEPIPVEPRAYAYVNLSQDDSRVALDIRDQENDIWVLNLVGGGMPQRLTFDPGFNRNPVWSPDGTRLAFSREVNGREEVHWQTWDGLGVPEQLTRDSPAGVMPLGFSRDTLLYANVARPIRLFTAPLGATAMAGAPLRFEVENGALSPDGRWLAYQAVESGKNKIYVRPFPDVDSGLWQASDDGMRPRWRDDGRELFFLRADGPTVSVMSVAVESGEVFRHGPPQRLLQGPYVIPQAGANNYDATRDGSRFLMIKNAADPDATPTRIVIVQNWFEEVKRLVPAE